MVAWRGCGGPDSLVRRAHGDRLSHGEFDNQQTPRSAQGRAVGGGGGRGKEGGARGEGGGAEGVVVVVVY